jgi:ADP-ribose pyrophosphatase YjhB (NUDIX family)
MTTPGHPVTVTGLITDLDGRALIIHPAVGQPEVAQVWWLPGGELDYGASPAQYLRHVVYQQLNIQIPVRDLHLTAYRHAHSPGEQPELVLLFDCGRHDATVIEDQLWPRDGVAAWRWATHADATRLLHPDEARRLTWALTHPRQARYLEQPQHHQHTDTGGAHDADDVVGRSEASDGPRPG